MEDEKDLSLDNDSDNVASNDNIDNEIPNDDQGLNNEKIGNGYNGLASSNREAFARGLNDNYDERIARNRANLEAARARANNPNKENKSDNSEDDSEVKEKNLLDKAGDKANLLKSKADLLSSQIDNVRSKAFKAMHPVEAAKMVAKKKFMAWLVPILISSLPIILLLFAGLLTCLLVVNFFYYDVELSDGSFSGVYDGGDFTIYSTLLSKEEFEEQLGAAVSKYPKLQIFASNAGNIYDIALSEGVNPELVVVRAIAEGFSPGTLYNYWGIGCTNTGGGRDCKKYVNFNAGVRDFVKLVASYSSLVDLMSRYAYIGRYWYNPGSAGLGGCYYAPYIFDEIPDRVQNACTKLCTPDNTLNCVETTDDDQTAYATWQVAKMLEIRNSIFDIKVEVDDDSGDSDDPGGSPSINISDDEIIKLSDADAWNVLTGRSSRDAANSVSQTTMDSRMVWITVPIRVWSDTTGYSTKKSTAKLQVNRALADLYTKFFTDIYNETGSGDDLFVINPRELYCYNYRPTTSGTRLSAHAYGVACDINWSSSGNGYGQKVYTKSEWKNLRKSREKYQILYKDSKVVQIAHRYTLSWGGEWRSVTDAMHFSFIGDESRAVLQSKY